MHFIISIVAYTKEKVPLNQLRTSEKMGMVLEHKSPEYTLQRFIEGERRKSESA